MKDKIKSLIRQIKANQIADKHLLQLKARAAENEDRLRFLESCISIKKKDIKKLEERNVYSIFKQLVGRKEIELDLHRRHYLELSIEYNELMDSLPPLKYEIELLEGKQKDIPRMIEELRRALLVNENLLDSIQLENYRSIVTVLKRKLSVAKELEEAILEGVNINKRFNAAIRFIRKFYEGKRTRSAKKRVDKYSVENLQKYQNYIVQIKHNFIRYELEINDVYQEIIKDSTYQSNIEFDFIKEYKVNLAKDILNAKRLDESLNFLLRYKAIILNLNKLLRKDLRSVNKSIAKLEQEEEHIINSYRS